MRIIPDQVKKNRLGKNRDWGRGRGKSRRLALSGEVVGKGGKLRRGKGKKDEGRRKETITKTGGTIGWEEQKPLE